MQFDDASLFQTWSYGISGPATHSVSHVVIKEGDDPLGCCQVVIRKSPFLNIGIAYVNRGPLCLRKGRIFKPDILVQIIREIKEEYAIKRGYLLRFWPHAVGERKEVLRKTLESEGFLCNTSERPYRSLKIDLTPSIDDMRKDLLRKWRGCLNQAERNGLTIIEGTSLDIFDTLVLLAKKVEQNKNFEDYTDYALFRNAQVDLHEQFKVNLVLCEHEHEPVCAAGYSAIGDTAYYVLAGTDEKAYALNATYLVQWQMVKRLKESGVHYFDLGPFNIERNPGVYHFKKGLAGKNGWEETFLLEYSGCFSIRNRIAKHVLESLRSFRSILKSLSAHKWKASDKKIVKPDQ